MDLQKHNEDERKICKVLKQKEKNSISAKREG